MREEVHCWNNHRRTNNCLHKFYHKISLYWLTINVDIETSDNLAFSWYLRLRYFDDNFAWGFSWCCDVNNFIFNKNIGRLDLFNYLDRIFFQIRVFFIKEQWEICIKSLYCILRSVWKKFILKVSSIFHKFSEKCNHQIKFSVHSYSLNE